MVRVPFIFSIFVFLGVFFSQMTQYFSSGFFVLVYRRNNTLCYPINRASWRSSMVQGAHGHSKWFFWVWICSICRATDKRVQDREKGFEKLTERFREQLVRESDLYIGYRFFQMIIFMTLHHNELINAPPNHHGSKWILAPACRFSNSKKIYTI